MKRILLTAVLLSAFTGIAHGATINFNNTEVPTIFNGALVTDQWNPFGVDVSNAYWYTDTRDPFDQMGLANWYGTSNNVGRIDLLGGATTDTMTVDWLSIAGTIYIDAYNSSDNLLDSFSAGVGTGTQTLTGTDISYLTWHDTGGFVAISTLSFDTGNNVSVPEPSTMLLLGSGVLGLGFVRRKFKG